MATEKKYDLLERTAVYAERVRDYGMRLPKNAANNVYVPQLQIILRPTRAWVRRILK